MRWPADTESLGAQGLHPLDPFLDALAVQGGPDGVAVRERVYRTLAVELHWDRRALRAALRSQLAWDEEGRARFDALFDGYFPEAEDEPALRTRAAKERLAVLRELSQPPPPPPAVPAPTPPWTLGRWVSQIAGRVADALRALMVTDRGVVEVEPDTPPAGWDARASSPKASPPLTPPPAIRTLPTSRPVSTRVERPQETSPSNGRNSPISTQGLKSSQEEATGSAAGLITPHTALEDLEPDLRARDPARPLSATELDQLAYAVGHAAATGSCHLDMRATVILAARSAGAIQPIWLPSHQIRPLRISVSRDLGPVTESFLETLAQGFEMRGVPVNVSRESSAESLTSRDVAHCIVVVNLSQQGATDLHQLKSATTTHVFEARDPLFWGQETTDPKLAIFELSFAGLHSALHGHSPNTPSLTEPAREPLGPDSLGDTLPLAAACALAAPLDLSTIDTIRRTFTPNLPYIRIQRIQCLRGVTTDPSGWRFSHSLTRALFERVDRGLLYAVGRWQLQRLNRIVTRANTPAARHIARERGLIGFALAGEALPVGGAVSVTEVEQFLDQLGRGESRTRERIRALLTILPQVFTGTGQDRRALQQLGIRVVHDTAERANKASERTPERDPKTRGERESTTKKVGGVSRASRGARGTALGIDLAETSWRAVVVGERGLTLLAGPEGTTFSPFAADEEGMPGRLYGRALQVDNPAHQVVGRMDTPMRGGPASTDYPVGRAAPPGTANTGLRPAGAGAVPGEELLGQRLRPFLGIIKDAAAPGRKVPVLSAVVAVPLHITMRQTQAVTTACQETGVAVLRLLSRTTAAAIAYGHGKNLSRRVAVYELGEESFNFAVVEIMGSVFDVITAGGDYKLGGTDFSQRITSHLLDWGDLRWSVDLSYDRGAISHLRRAAEAAKRELSVKDQVKVHVRGIVPTATGVEDFEMVLSREVLETLTKDLIERTIASCERLMHDAGLSTADISEVILIGGQSRMPLVRSEVARHFGRPPYLSLDPDTAVAMGAALVAESMVSKRTSSTVTLLDLLAGSIGLRGSDGTMHILFKKGQPLPDHKTRTLTTWRDGQSSMRLQFFQGESSVASENELLGVVNFSGLRAAPKGAVRLSVVFFVDSGGVLDVTARDELTGHVIEGALHFGGAPSSGGD